MKKHSKLSVWQESVELAALTEELTLKLTNHPHLRAALSRQSYLPAILIAEAAEGRPTEEFINKLLDALNAIRKLDVLFSIGEQLEVFSRANRYDLDKQMKLVVELAHEKIINLKGHNARKVRIV